MVKKHLLIVLSLIFFSLNLSGKTNDSNRHRYDSLVELSLENLRYKLEEATQNIEEAKEIAETNNFEHSLEFIYQYGRIIRNYRHYDEALKYLNQALDTFLLRKDYYHISEAYYIIGWTYFGKGEYPTAYNYYQQSFDIAKKKGFGEFLVKTTFAWAVLESRNGNSDKDLELYLKSVDYSFEYEYTERLDHIYHFIGRRYMNAEDYENAIKYFKLAYNLKIKFEDYYHLVRGTSSIGWSYYLLGNLDSALHYITICQKLSSEHNEPYYYANTTTDIAIINRDKGNYEEALKLFSQSLSISKEYNIKSNLYWIYEERAKLYDSLANYEMAFTDYLNAIVYVDSAINSDYQVSLIEASAKFDRFLHEKEMESLEADNELKNLQLSRINYIIIGLIFIIVLSLNIYLLKNRKEKLRSIQTITELSQQVLRQQMNPHFIFNTLNSIQFSIFKNNKIESNKYLSLFAKYMRLVLDNSQIDNVTVKDEIAGLELYLELEKMRFKDKLNYIIEVDDDVDIFEHTTPPFLIQPYLENTISQNDKNAQKLELSILFKLLDNRIFVLINDNLSQQIIDDKKTKDVNNFQKLTDDKIKLINSVYKEDITYNYKYSRNESNIIIGRTVEIFLPHSA